MNLSEIMWSFGATSEHGDAAMLALAAVVRFCGVLHCLEAVEYALAYEPSSEKARTAKQHVERAYADYARSHIQRTTPEEIRAVLAATRW